MKSATIEQPKAGLPVVGKAQVTGWWSPQVVEALLKIVAEPEVEPDMSAEEVMRKVSRKRKTARKV